MKCRCVWADARCPNKATQEDGLCDWCGSRRTDDLRGNPNAIFDLETPTPAGCRGAAERWPTRP